MSFETRYNVKICASEKPFKVEKGILESLKGVASGKMLRKMKSEFVNCPVLGRERVFLECFACDNFIRRFKGEVHCEGLPLEDSSLVTS